MVGKLKKSGNISTLLGITMNREKNFLSNRINLGVKGLKSQKSALSLHDFDRFSQIRQRPAHPARTMRGVGSSA